VYSVQECWNLKKLYKCTPYSVRRSDSENFVRTPDSGEKGLVEKYFLVKLVRCRLGRRSTFFCAKKGVAFFLMDCMDCFGGITPLGARLSKKGQTSHPIYGLALVIVLAWTWFLNPQKSKTQMDPLGSTWVYGMQPMDMH
jgi:hypothetical protein